MIVNMLGRYMCSQLCSPKYLRLESLIISNNEGDSYKKGPLKRCFKPYRSSFLELNSKGQTRSLGKEEENRCPEFTSSRKRENRAVLRRSLATTAKKCTKLQSCCLANLNISLF